MKLKLCYVLRDQAARTFHVMLATKQGKLDFEYLCTVPHPGFSDHIFGHRVTGRLYRLQGNYCVIVYAKAP